MNERNSSIELLGIFCAFGIIMLHVWGGIYDTAAGTNRIILILVNSVFNTGVSCFMLISGYFGIKYSDHKCISLWVKIWVCSIIGQLISIIINGGSALGAGSSYDGSSLGSILTSLFPIVRERNWFITSYFIIFLLSDYINAIPQKLSKRNFEKLCFILLFFFSIAPTFVIYQIIGDNGKNIVNMTLVYLLGRYIGIYYNENNNKVRWGVLSLFSITLIFAGNCFATFSGWRDSNVWCPFSIDASLFIIIASISLFMTFKKLRLHSQFINSIAKRTLTICMLEGVVLEGAKLCLDFQKYNENNIFIFVTIVYTIINIFLCSILDLGIDRIVAFAANMLNKHLLRNKMLSR